MTDYIAGYLHSQQSPDHNEIASSIPDSAFRLGLGFGKQAVDVSQNVLGISDCFGYHRFTRRRIETVQLRCQSRCSQNCCGNKQCVRLCGFHSAESTMRRAAPLSYPGKATFREPRLTGLGPLDRSGRMASSVRILLWAGRFLAKSENQT
jgi:hypothetical protein